MVSSSISSLSEITSIAACTRSFLKEDLEFDLDLDLDAEAMLFCWLCVWFGLVWFGLLWFVLFCCVFVSGER